METFPLDLITSIPGMRQVSTPAAWETSRPAVATLPGDCQGDLSAWAGRRDSPSSDAPSREQTSTSREVPFPDSPSAPAPRPTLSSSGDRAPGAGRGTACVPCLSHMPGLKQATTKQRSRCQGCAWGGQAPPRWPCCPHCQGRVKGYSDSHQCPKQTVQNSLAWGRWDVTAPLLSQLRVQFSLCPSPSK